MNFASESRLIYARSARKSSRSDQGLDKPSDRHKTPDPLSQVFSLLNVRAARCTRFEAGGNWSYRFPAKPALKFGAVIRGDCWIDFGDEAHHRLVSGDCFLLANAPAYVLANDQRLAPEDGIAAFDWTQSDVARHAGRDTVLLAGSFGFEASDAGLLLDALPRFLLIPSRSPSAAVIHSTLEILDLEIRGTGIGAAVLTDRLADVLLVQVLTTGPWKHCPKRSPCRDPRFRSGSSPWWGWRRSTTCFDGECDLHAIFFDVERPFRQRPRSLDTRRRAPSDTPSSESTARHRSDTGADRRSPKNSPSTRINYRDVRRHVTGRRDLPSERSGGLFPPPLKAEKPQGVQKGTSA